VGAVAEVVGISVRTLHHWDEIGLVRPSTRTTAGYRSYQAEDIGRLHRVLVYRELGFALMIRLDSGLSTIYDRRLIRAGRGLSFTIPILIAARIELDAFLLAEGMPLAVMTADADAPLGTIGRVAGLIPLR